MAIGLPWLATAGDLTRGVTFSDGQRLTASELHQLVDDASISTDFLTTKPAASSVLAGDDLLIYSASGSAFYKVTAQTLLYGNTSLITGEPEKTAPQTNDYALIYDAGGGVLSKVSLGNLCLDNTNLLPGFPLLDASNVLLSDVLWDYHGGTNNGATLASLCSAFDYSTPWTNLTFRTAISNADTIPIFDSVARTNRQMTLAGLLTNAPPVTAISLTNPPISGADTFLLWSTATNTDNPAGTNSHVAKVSYSTVSNTLQQAWAAQLQTNFVSGLLAVPNANNSIVTTNTAHGLPGKPQLVRWVLVCQTAELGYVSNDEVDVASLYDAGGTKPAFTWGADATNVWLIEGNKPAVYKKDASGASAMTLADWDAKCYAEWFPTR